MRCKLHLYLNTVRHLRPRQVGWRLVSRARQVFEDPGRTLRRPVPAFPGCRWAPRGEFLAPGRQRNSAADLKAGRMTFLNRTMELGWPPRWREARAPRLWLYNLHCFDWLWALDFRDAGEVVLDWLKGQRARVDQAAWEPYPVSLRIGNWCAVLFGKFRRETETDPAFAAEIWRGVHAQAEWLSRHLERDLLGNHLLENAAALCMAGACFSGAAAARWFEIGSRLLARELREQILPDGGHFERSPMYHARAVHVLAALLNTGSPELEQIVSDPLARMTAWLAAMCHPDGDIALFNDSVLGEQREPAALAAYARRLLARDLGSEKPEEPFDLAASGYYGCRDREGDGVICDAGAIGPDCQPGHAHGDIFSFEMSVGGRRAIVDAGVHDYEPGDRRAWSRSTRAHNTVEVDGADQCEFWGVFRVARRGRPCNVEWRDTGNGFRLSGWHDGYFRLPGKPRHERLLVWHRPAILMVRDRVTAARSVQAVSRLHLHPDCVIRGVRDNSVTVELGGGLFQVAFAGEGRLAVEDSRYFPEFGVERANKALAFAAEGRAVETGFCVAGGDHDVFLDLARGATIGTTSCSW